MIMFILYTYMHVCVCVIWFLIKKQHHLHIIIIFFLVGVTRVVDDDGFSLYSYLGFGSCFISLKVRLV